MIWFAPNPTPLSGVGGRCANRLCEFDVIVNSSRYWKLDFLILIQFVIQIVIEVGM